MTLSAELVSAVRRNVERQQRADATRKAVRSAFATLRHKGYFARMNFWCCQGCAWNAVPEGRGGKVVFFHQQDNEDLARAGRVHIAWAGDYREILAAFKGAGLAVIWDGSNDSRFEVLAP